MFRHDGRSEEELALLASEYRRRHGLARQLRRRPIRSLQHVVVGMRQRHQHRNLFVAGLPKSGSTWLERMLVDVPGYRSWTPGYVPNTGHDLLAGTLTHPPLGFTITRVHTRPTEHNLRVLHECDRPYVILYRDLRDVIVSSYFYARNDRDVVHHEIANSMEMPEWIDHFLEHRLTEYAAWCVGWVENGCPERRLITRYEDLLQDTPGELRRIVSHCGVAIDDAQVDQIAERHSFRRATGRASGEEDVSSFNRKGVAGDWKNHFSDVQHQRFVEIAGKAMEMIGYSNAS